MKERDNFFVFKILASNSVVDKDQTVFGNSLAVTDIKSNTRYSKSATPNPVGLKGGWQKQKIRHAQIDFKMQSFRQDYPHSFSAYGISMAFLNNSTHASSRDHAQNTQLTNPYYTIPHYRLFEAENTSYTSTT